MLLDTDLFDGIHPRNWGKKLREFVYNNLAGSELTMYDENGNPEAVFIANEKDRVQKLSAKNNHRVIDKLARNSGDNIRSLATVHLSEALLTSKNETSTDEHSHQWMDENGWRYRTVYLQDVSGNIFTATLNIANGRNGGILYDINNIRKVDNAKRETTGGVVPSAVSGGARSTSHSFSSDSSIQQGQKNVKQKFSLDEDIAALDEAYSRRMAEADEAQETARDDSDAAAEKKRPTRGRRRRVGGTSPYDDSWKRKYCSTASKAWFGCNHFLGNGNRLNRILPRSQILKSLTLTAMVEPMSSIISSDRVNVKQKISLDEDVAALDEAYSRRMAEADEAQETAKDDSDAAAEKKRPTRGKGGRLLALSATGGARKRLRSGHRLLHDAAEGGVWRGRGTPPYRALVGVQKTGRRGRRPVFIVGLNVMLRKR